MKEFPSAGSLCRNPQGQHPEPEAERLGLPHAWQDLNYLNHHHCLPQCASVGGWSWELSAGAHMLEMGHLTSMLNP